MLPLAKFVHRGLAGSHISYSRFSTNRRVVVTGLGLVSPLGVGAHHAFKNLVEGKGGVVKYDATLSYESNPWSASSNQDQISLKIPSKVAALVPRPEANPFNFQPFVPEAWISREIFSMRVMCTGYNYGSEEGIVGNSSLEERYMSTFIQFAISAAKQAVADAGWCDISALEKEKTGVCFGSGIGSLLDTVSTWEGLSKRGYSKISPFYVPRILTNMAAGHISMAFGFQGPNHGVSTACTTGAHSLGDAMRFIQFGDADVMVAGGSEASVHALSVGGFSRARSLSTRFNESPHEASRPFDKDRDGFVIGEGAGAVVLEELEHAKKRGARIYAEMKGYGLSGDAHHMTSPPDSGRGAQRAMLRALETASLSPCDIDYINAHATSTEKGDAIENRAIREIFSAVKDRLAVSSSKGSIGHLLGAAGAVEAIFTILALYEGILPPTRNLHNLSGDASEFPFNYVPHLGQRSTLRAALTNSFGFGGTNASLCFSKYS